MWKFFRRRVWGIFSALTAVLGIGGWGDDAAWWADTLGINPMLSGVLLGAGSLGLLLFVVARWGEVIRWPRVRGHMLAWWSTQRTFRLAWAVLRTDGESRDSAQGEAFVVAGRENSFVIPARGQGQYTISLFAPKSCRVLFGKPVAPGDATFFPDPSVQGDGTTTYTAVGALLVDLHLRVTPHWVRSK